MDSPDVLVGKSVLLDIDLPGYSNALETFGMRVILDRERGYAIAERMMRLLAAVAVYGVSTPVALMAIQDVPPEMQSRIVVLQHQSSVQKGIEQTGVHVVWRGVGWDNNLFKEALVQAVMASLAA